MEAIKVEGLSFSYTPGTPILRNISFSVEPGQFVSLLGPNGAGKSTLFSCMLSLQKKYTGKIYINGSDIASLSPRSLAAEIAYVPQSAEHSFSYPVESVILMGTTHGFSAFSAPGRKEHDAVREAMERMNITYLQGKMFRSISGGERQLVLIARAIAQQAHILFMDEPTASLDYGNQCRVLSEIRRLSHSGYTVIQSTHSPQQALMYSDSIIALQGGEIAAHGRANEVITSELLSKLYGLNVRIVSVPGEKTLLCVPDTTV